MASAASPWANIVCFLTTVRIFLPSPMVARNTSGSNPPFFLVAMEGDISGEYSLGTNGRWRNRMPQLKGFETESGFGEWRMVKGSDAFALDRKIHAAGWNLFFMASEVKAMF